MAEQDMTTAEQVHADIPGWGVDGDPRTRPGVPMLAKPEPRGGAHWKWPESQPAPDFEVFKRAELDELTPTFGTAAPPRGLSGVLRRVAYGIPENRTRHVMLLLMADRVDVLESRLLGSPAKSLRTLLGLVGGSWLRGRLRT